MLYRTVHNAFDCHDQIDQISARHFSASILQLLSNMCREAMEVPEITNTRRKRLPLIATYLDEHLADEGVSPKTVSNALGCSVRTLHRMFRARSGLTFGAYLWQRRLERCVADLRDPRQSMRSITDIAHGWGFSSSAHFNRLFKASMGQSPGHYREGGQAGP
jgi:AraC-like DNA-binding protein